MGMWRKLTKSSTELLDLIISYDSCYSFLVLSMFGIGKLEEAEMLFRRMLAGGLMPDGWTSSTIIRWLCQQSRGLDGYQLIDEVEKYAIGSDIYSLLMDGLCEVNHLVEAVKLASIIVGKGIQLKGTYVKNVIECRRR